MWKRCTGGSVDGGNDANDGEESVPEAAAAACSEETGLVPQTTMEW